MKNIRNILSLLLALLMAVSLAIGACAEEGDSIPSEPTATPEVTTTPEPTATPVETTTPEPSDTPEPTATPLAAAVNVPTPSYTLNIPAAQTVPFGAQTYSLALPTVSEAGGFSAGQVIALTIGHTAFVSDTASTAIPFEIKVVSTEGAEYTLDEGSVYYHALNDSSAAATPSLVFAGGDSVELSQLMLHFATADWQRALGGEYSADITFTSAIVEP